MTTEHQSNSHQDFIAKLEAARQKLPLKLLLEKYGRGPSNNNWKSFPKCPYCEGKNCAGVFAGAHGDFFKCYRASCPSGTSGEQAAWDEIGFLAFELKLNRPAATREWLKEACVWDENEKPSEYDSHSGKTLNEDSEGQSSSPAEKSDSIFEEFIARTRLIDSDRRELKEDRGLTAETIDRGCFRTNDRFNLAVLKAMALEFPEWQLAQYGLYSRHGNFYKPSGQFYGYGVVGKKKRLSSELLESGDYDDLDDDDFVWEHKETGLCNPILIPYFDLNGKIIGIRPHKGFPKGQKPRLYLAGGRQPIIHCKNAVIVEGEFKAVALQSVVGNEWAVASVPGISQLKNPQVGADISYWLKQIGA